MSSSVAAFLLRRAIRPIVKVRHFSSFASSLATPRVLAPKTLAENRIKQADKKFLRFLKAEIEGDQDADEQRPQEAKLPKDFPFEIIDNPGDRSVLLKREFQGEKIQVAVSINFDEDTDEDEAEQDAAKGQNTDDDLEPRISLVVTVDKGSGLTLEFCCNLDAKDLEIESMAMKRSGDSDAEVIEGPAYSGYRGLDEGFQWALRKYVGARGIKVSLYEFLQKYMTTKYDREYIFWLKNLKEFVENSWLPCSLLLKESAFCMRFCDEF